MLWVLEGVFLSKSLLLYVSNFVDSWQGICSVTLLSQKESTPRPRMGNAENIYTVLEIQADYHLYFELTSNTHRIIRRRRSLLAFNPT